MKERISSGNKDLDLILGGGFPPQSVLLIGGGTGTGKTTLAHQILYANLKKDSKAVYMTVLGKPMHKILQNMQTYEFFNQETLMQSVDYEDMGHALEREGLKKILDYVFYTVSQSSPDFFCVDGLQRFQSISHSDFEYISFLYELSGVLSAFPCTSIWAGMFTEPALLTSPEASISDHVIYLGNSPDGNRNLRIMKLAQTQSISEEYAYSITSRGLRIDSAKFAKRPSFQPQDEIVRS